MDYYSRLTQKSAQRKIDKLDNLLEKYGIRDKKSVNRDKITTLLKEIMLN